MKAFGALCLLTFFVVTSIAESPEKLRAFAGQAPYFISQPRSTTNYFEGGSASFTVVAGGTAPLSYQWLKESTPIPGANSPTLNLSNVTREKDGGNYQVTVSNESGSITSTNAYLFVWSNVPGIIQQPESVFATEFDVVSLSVWMVTTTFPVTYQWYKNGIAIPEANDPEIWFRPVRYEDAGVYTVTIRNSYGSVTSAPATISVRPTPAQIWDHPDYAGVGVAKGLPFFLSITARGTPPFQYQWFRTITNSGQLVTEPIGTSEKVTLPNAQPGDMGEYWVEVSNAAGKEISPKFPVVVEDVPIIVAQPPNQVAVFPAQSVPLTVQIVGYGVMVQWFRDGTMVAIEGSPVTTNSLRSTFRAPGWDGLGDYIAVVSNQAGAVTSIVSRVERKLPEAKRSPAASVPNLAQDLVAYWRFDEPETTKVKDVAGHYDMDLSPYGRYESGRIGNGLSFGSEGAIYRSTSPTDELPINRNPAFTISLWVRFFNNYNIGHPFLFLEGDSEATNTLFALASDSWSEAMFQFVQEPGEKVDLHTDSLILANAEWRHLVFVQEENGQRWFYIDGIEADISFPARPANNWKLNFTRLGSPEKVDTLSAQLFCCPRNRFTLDDVALWKRALSAEEIQSVITDGIPGFGSQQDPPIVNFVSFQQTGSIVTLSWKSTQSGSYSLLKSVSLNGPWTVVTNATASDSETNIFTELVAGDPKAFYQIRLGSP